MHGTGRSWQWDCKLSTYTQIFRTHESRAPICYLHPYLKFKTWRNLEKLTAMLTSLKWFWWLTSGKFNTWKKNFFNVLKISKNILHKTQVNNFEKESKEYGHLHSFSKFMSFLSWKTCICTNMSSCIFCELGLTASNLKGDCFDRNWRNYILSLPSLKNHKEY